MMGMKSSRFVAATALIGAAYLLFISRANAASDSVRAWEENVVIPTYAAGEPEPNPIFYFGRASQGAQGRVYPYPLYDSLTNVKADKTYRMLYLENEYIKIGILPEIGGRLFEAVDKTNNYDFVYHQHVIKPALIGLIGAWISGGIEWNIPHHHRATTFLPVQSKVLENSDGSKTIWVGELELRQRMRWAVGYTLYPGKSLLECSVRITNRTPLANTMLCFANVAVHANDQYQVIFPPSTQYVTFHAKREFTTWPIATTRFNGADFTAGVDVSRYKNHNSAMSMFAWNYEDDFFGGYDHGREAGIVSVADHHLVPGKKFWTWGNGPRGRMWDKILTDNDGPYIELMTGAYSDNQPDYSWLQPYETKSFTMNWYPIRDIGGVKKANLAAAVNLEVPKMGTAKLGFCTPASHPQATVLLKAGDRVIHEENVAIGPAKPYIKDLPIHASLDAPDLRASLSADGKELVAYEGVRLSRKPMPEPVSPPPAPKDIKTLEELYLAGQRIEQFHAPGQEPEPYWEEALKRDPGDARVNTALGIRRLREARFAEAEQHFRAAIKRLATNYTSPKDGEPFYYLGVALDSQGKQDEAFDAFFKATWSQAWRGPAYFGLAQVASRRGEYREALRYVEQSMEANALNLPGLNLKAALLRHLGRIEDCHTVLDFIARNIDPLEVHLFCERWLAHDAVGEELTDTPRDHPAAVLEAAVEYANAGLNDDAASTLIRIIDSAKDKNRISPLVFYYLAEFGDKNRAEEYRALAARMSPEYVFPFQWEAIPVLRRAIEANPNDARARFYLGNLLFDWQPEEAVKLWEQAVKLEPSLAIVHRNLAAAYSHRKPALDNRKAIEELEAAVSLPQKYALHFAELDELYAATGASPEKRLALLEKNHDIVSKRDDALSREIGLKVFAGKYDEAVALMSGRRFAVWEGGTLDVADHWVNAHLLRGRQELANKQFGAALADFKSAAEIPDNLPNDRGAGDSRAAEIAYWRGNAFDGKGEQGEAKRAWQEAARFTMPTQRRGMPEGRISQRQVQMYYQAMAKKCLGQNEEPAVAFHNIIEMANRAIARSEETSDGADVSDVSSARNSLAFYVRGLGYLGLSENDQARSDFRQALALAPDNLDAHFEVSLITAADSK
jgi:tetratricopeptide (TPR) repeat protein